MFFNYMKNLQPYIDRELIDNVLSFIKTLDDSIN